jgi:hypothetical protein
METIQQLMQQSLGVGVGMTVGSLIGLSVRKRRGKGEGLIGGSVFVTAAAIGAVCMAVMMLITWIGGQI